MSKLWDRRFNGQSNSFGYLKSYDRIGRDPDPIWVEVPSDKRKSEAHKIPQVSKVDNSRAPKKRMSDEAIANLTKKKL